MSNIETQLYITYHLLSSKFCDKYFMPRLSLYRPNKQNDYRFLDRIISEQLTVGGTDLYIHKYLGPSNQGPSIDYTQPQYDTLNPTNIQDLLFLENRDRSYDPNIYRLRGHYSVQNLDFDLSQFGLFLNNDIIFITVHYNDMIDIIGRKLMVGDVLELPHLLDYNPLNETIPTALKRFMQITDANYASEGFSQTWFPHLWRIKCEPLVDSEEFSQILSEPINQDTYLGQWDSTKTYPAGYVVTYGDKNYVAKIEVPVNITPPNATYWELDTADNLRDILATYNKNIEINNAVIDEAKRIVPKAGYDNSKLYVIPTYGVFESNGVLSNKLNQPAPPYDTQITSSGIPGVVTMMRDPKYKNPSAAIRISKSSIQGIWDQTIDMDVTDILDKFVNASLQVYETVPQRTRTGSGPVRGDFRLSIQSIGAILGPYGTADNTYATADQDPTAPGFTGTITPKMDYRADCDPRFQYITRYTPRSFSYANGYLTGDGSAPNGLPTGTGIAFPQNPQVGDYFLRIDYMPNVLFRWDGVIWARMSSDVRTETGFTSGDKSLLSGFINDTNEIFLQQANAFVPEAQALSTILDLEPGTVSLGTVMQQVVSLDGVEEYIYIPAYSPRSFSYANGYLTGDGNPPNGFPAAAGTSFPLTPEVGNYFLRIDYLPNVLFRWNGVLWDKISTNVRTETGFTSGDKSLLSGFINNEEQIYLQQTDSLVNEAQPLSTILQLKPDNLPPVE